MAFDFKDTNPQPPDSQQPDKKADPLVYQVDPLDPTGQKNIRLAADKTQPADSKPTARESHLGSGWRRTAANNPDPHKDKDPQAGAGTVLGNWVEGGAASAATAAIGAKIIRDNPLDGAARATLNLYRGFGTWPVMDPRRGEQGTRDKNGWPLEGHHIRIENIFDAVDPVSGSRFPQLTPLEFARTLPTFEHRLTDRYNDPNWGLDAAGNTLPGITRAHGDRFTGQYNDFTQQYIDHWKETHGGVAPQPRSLMEHLEDITAEWRTRTQARINFDSRGRGGGGGGAGGGDGDLVNKAVRAVTALEVEIKHAYPWFQFRAQHSTPDPVNYPEFVPYKIDQGFRYTLRDVLSPTSVFRHDRDYYSRANADDLFGRYGHYSVSGDDAGYQKWLLGKRFALGAASALTPTVLSNLDPVSRVIASIATTTTWMSYAGIKNGPDAQASGEAIQGQIKTRLWRTGALMAGGALLTATAGPEVNRLMSDTQSVAPWLHHIYEPTETQSIGIGIGMGYPVRRNWAWRVPTILVWSAAGLGLSKLGIKEPIRGLFRYPFQSSSEPSDGEGK